MSQGQVSLERRLVHGEPLALADVSARQAPLLASDDLQEGLRAFVERRPGRFRGR